MITNNTTTTKEFYVEGMHCSACELLIEKKLLHNKNIKEVKVNASNKTLKITYNNNVSFKELKELLKETKYKLTEQSQNKNEIYDYGQLLKAFALSLGIILIFFLFQRLNLINNLQTDTITLPFVFLIGLVASVSTCMAVVGGIVLSMSATYAQTNDKNIKSKLFLFHMSRLVGFFILGGFIGLVGTVFTVTPTINFLLNMLLFFIMIVLGFNLLEAFDFTKKLQLTMPKALGRKVVNTKHESGIITPITMGIATFFLPCGFTQSMQFYALSTNNFWQGASVMLTFALGTLPMLTIISLSSVKFGQQLQSKLFFKTVGFVIIYFGLYGIYNVL